MPIFYSDRGALYFRTRTTAITAYTIPSDKTILFPGRDKNAAGLTLSSNHANNYAIIRNENSDYYIRFHL